MSGSSGLGSKGHQYSQNRDLFEWEKCVTHAFFSFFSSGYCRAAGTFQKFYPKMCVCETLM